MRRKVWLAACGFLVYLLIIGSQTPIGDAQGLQHLQRTSCTAFAYEYETMLRTPFREMASPTE